MKLTELDFIIDYKRAFQDSQASYNELQRDYIALQRVLAQALLERKTPLRVPLYVFEDDCTCTEIHSQRNEMNDCTEYWATTAVKPKGAVE